MTLHYEIEYGVGERETQNKHPTGSVYFLPTSAVRDSSTESKELQYADHSKHTGRQANLCSRITRRRTWWILSRLVFVRIIIYFIVFSFLFDRVKRQRTRW